jgi:hypothetical protein
VSLTTLAGTLPARLDPGNTEARQWLRDELAKPAYRDTRDPLTRAWDALMNWLADLLSRLNAPAHPLPTFAAGVVALLIVALVVWMLRFVRRTKRRDTAAVAPVRGDERLTADQYRARAARALSEGAYAACLLDLMRAIAQEAVQRTLLEDVPSLTAHEIADRLAVVFPGSAGELHWAAERFDAVAYGDALASRPDTERVAALDRTLAASRPARGGGAADGGDRSGLLASGVGA